MAHLYCLDASSCSLLSEDYHDADRWRFMRELVACHARSVLLGGGRPPRQAALIASRGGKAGVALHPCSEAATLQQALGEVQPEGEANLQAALKLALLVSRRFPAGSTHVTAFVASPGAAASLVGGPPAAIIELRQRYQAAEVSLDVAVLCPREELGAAAAAALEALTGCGRSSGSGCSDGGASSSNRLLWLTPVESAEDSWQQLEPALEQLERRAGGSGASTRTSSSSEGGSDGASALPRRISREPRTYDPLRHPRAALLAQRSGVQQPALCRGESLSRLGHLSSDGMMRPWLPTYASLAQAAGGGARGAAAAVAGSGGSGQMCYVEVQPVPKWRTLIKVAAGRLLPQPAPVQAATMPDGSSYGSPGAGGYAAASSELLRSLEALSVLEAGEDGGASSSSSTAAAAPPPPEPVRYWADPQRGTLRLLQGTKEPHLLKLVWSAEQPAVAAGSSKGSASQEPPLDLFAAAAGASPRRSSLLGFMPAAAVAASAARGPLLREGAELWETAAEFDWELALPTEEREQDEEGRDGSAAGSSSSSQEAQLPASVEARQLPNGAQVVLVARRSSGGGGFGGLRAARVQRQQAAAFWLQQHVQPGSLDLPSYGTAIRAETAGPDAAAAAAAEPAGGGVAASSSSSGGGAVHEAPQQSSQPESSAEALAAVLLRHLARPPPVDLRRLRKDVQSGAIQVTPITVGPLPAAFVRDVVATRSAVMSAAGVENLDSWGDASAPSSSSGGSGNTAAKGGGQRLSPEGAAAAVQQHKSAVLSLLRQRLGRQPSDSGNKASGSSSGGAASLGAAGTQQPAPEADLHSAAGPDAAYPGSTAEAATAIPCSPQPRQSNTADSAPGSYPGSSSVETPFGTPLHILPSSLLGGLHGGSAAASVAGDDPAAADPDSADAEAAGSAERGGLPGSSSELLGPKREGSAAVAVGPADQAEGGEDMFPLLE